MIYKDRDVQPELFKNIETKKKTNIYKKNLFPINYESKLSASYDTLIVIIIVILMSHIVLFVCGMEKGKLLSLKDNNNNQVSLGLITEIKDKIELPPSDNTSLATENTQIPKEAAETISEQNKNSEPIPVKKREYAIQLVTYKNNTSAVKEVEQLKIKGVESFILKKGNYFVVYSGTYLDKNSAVKKLNSLKTKYKDCFLCSLNKNSKYTCN